MSEPDEALIEAIAEAIGTVATDHRSCTSNPANGARTCLCGVVLLRWNDWARHALDETARAAYAAMVEHLGLTEETRNLCSCGGHSTGAMHFMADDHGALPPERRLVSRWIEAQP
jgi:hypothetical protein